MINEGTPLSAPASHTEFPGCSTERDKSNRLPELNRTEQVSRTTEGAGVRRTEYHSREKHSERKCQRLAQGSPQVPKRKKKKNNKDLWGGECERETDGQT